MKASDLQPQRIVMNFTMGYEVGTNPLGQQVVRSGRAETVTLGLLSKHEWEAIGAEVDDAVPPPDKLGKPDYSSMRYRAEQTEQELKRNVRRLIRALEKGGDFDFEDTVDTEDRVELLRTIDAGVFNALFTQLQNATTIWAVKVSALAERFPSGNGRGVVPESEVADYAPAPEPVPSVG